MNLSLFHGKTQSAIICDDVIIQYNQKTHKYRSESDYSTIVTELNTYGITAANQVLDYLKVARAN